MYGIANIDFVKLTVSALNSHRTINFQLTIILAFANYIWVSILMRQYIIVNDRNQSRISANTDKVWW